MTERKKLNFCRVEYASTTLLMPAHATCFSSSSENNNLKNRRQNPSRDRNITLQLIFACNLSKFFYDHYLHSSQFRVHYGFIIANLSPFFWNLFQWARMMMRRSTFRRSPTSNPCPNGFFVDQQETNTKKKFLRCSNHIWI